MYILLLWVTLASLVWVEAVAAFPLFTALTLTFPAQIWDWASNSGGYDVEAMVKATKGATNLNPETRDKTVKYLVAQMDRLLGYRRPYAKKVRQLPLVSCWLAVTLSNAMLLVMNSIDIPKELWNITKLMADQTFFCNILIGVSLHF